MEDRRADLEPAIREQLVRYRDELLFWNMRFNLTALETAEAVDRRLIDDALRLLPALDRRVGERKQGRLIDIGTGAGFPGMVLKIVRPELDVTLLDATRKKISFLEHVIKELKLTGVTALHGRAEEVGQSFVYRARFDIATARAVTSIPALLELAMPLLKVGGVALFPKGAEIENELAEARAAAIELGSGPIVDELLAQLGEEHVTRLVFAVKIRETPKRYPRRSGIPAKEPLGRAKQ